MNRGDIAELHFIAPIANVPSIMQHGILSHRLAGPVPHHSVAMAEVQERRKTKQIPGARKLHEYANLYFDAHNATLSKLREYNNDVCVLRVDAKVLDLPGVIIADRNAASDMVGFHPAAQGLKKIDRDRVFAESWIHRQDPFDQRRHKSEKCAEVLVPDCVMPRYLVGAYVANQVALQTFQLLNVQLPVDIKSDIFF